MPRQHPAGQPLLRRRLYGGSEADDTNRRVGLLRDIAVAGRGGGDTAAGAALERSSSVPAANRRAVLCLHGFTGTPFEIQPITDALGRLGYDVEAPMLAGHGVDLAALETTGWPDWLRSAEQAFDALAARTADRIAVLGFSMGGLLALRLGETRRDRVAALAVLSAPLRLRRSQVRGIRMLGRIPRALRFGPLRSVPKIFGSNVSDRQARRANPGLSAMPLCGLLSLLELMTEVRSGLGAIRAPALVVHGRKDRTVPISASVELADRLTADSAGAGPDGETAIVERLWLERSCHLVGVDVEHGILSAAVGRFLETRGHW